MICPFFPAEKMKKMKKEECPSGMISRDELIRSQKMEMSLQADLIKKMEMSICPFGMKKNGDDTSSP